VGEPAIWFSGAGFNFRSLVIVDPQRRGIRDPAVFPNHPAHIFLGNSKFKTNLSAAPLLFDFNLGWVIHKRTGDIFNQFLHGLSLQFSLPP
jgi:hypothetical protein